MSDDWEFYSCRVDDRPASISFDIHGLSSTLVRLAEAHGGEYDGWETPIVS